MQTTYEQRSIRPASTGLRCLTAWTGLVCLWTCLLLALSGCVAETSSESAEGGDSGGETRGEFVHVGYACLPNLDDGGEPVLEAGKEFFLATHLSAGGHLAEGDARIASIYRTIVGRVLDGQLK